MNQQGESIIVRPNRFGAPGYFLWRGRKYPIDAVEHIWRSSHGLRQGRRIYKVRSRRKVYHLDFDRQLNHWRLIKTPWRTRLGLALERLAHRIAAT